MAQKMEEGKKWGGQLVSAATATRRRKMEQKESKERAGWGWQMWPFFLKRTKKDHGRVMGRKRKERKRKQGCFSFWR